MRANLYGSILVSVVVWAASVALTFAHGLWGLLYLAVGTIRSLSLMFSSGGRLLREPSETLAGWFVLNTVLWLPLEVITMLEDARDRFLEVRNDDRY